ncbi:MAG: glycosyltransferase family 4 protein [Candidatus Binataceae bacterium]
MILGVFTGLTAYGGIQQYGRLAAAVIARRAQEKGEEYRLLGLNDPPGRHEFTVADTSFTVAGFARNKMRIAAQVFADARATRLAYLNHPNLAPLGLGLRALRPATRYFTSTYGFEVWEPLSMVRRLGLRHADTVTAIAEFNATETIKFQGLEARKVAIVPCALDPDFNAEIGAAAPPLRRERSGGPMLLTVARLVHREHREHKGIDSVIEALPEVIRTVPDVCYVVLGDGDDRARLEQLARDVGVGDRVIFTGALGDAAVRSFYQACEVFVMPSRSEGFGIVFLEAMALGKPVIGGNHGGTPEIWKDGTAGFLVEHGDTAALADRIKLLLRDGALRARMGAAGRRIVATRFSFDHFRRNFAELLN